MCFVVGGAAAVVVAVVDFGFLGENRTETNKNLVNAIASRVFVKQNAFFYRMALFMRAQQNFVYNSVFFLLSFVAVVFFFFFPLLNSFLLWLVCFACFYFSQLYLFMVRLERIHGNN